MKLYLKKKHFSLRTQFTIFDEFEETRYYVNPAFISLVRHFHILDKDMNEVAEVQKSLGPIISLYKFTLGGQDAGDLRAKTSFMKVKYSWAALGWEIKSNFLQTEYVITKNEMQIGTIHKKMMTWGESYEFEFEDENDEIPMAALVVAIIGIKNDENDENRDLDN